MLARQIRDELLIALRLRPTQFVIEMNSGNYDAEFVPQFQQQMQERNRVNPSRDGNADAISSLQQILPPNVGKHALCQ
jgi:hypothetical protein